MTIRVNYLACLHAIRGDSQKTSTYCFAQKHGNGFHKYWIVSLESLLNTPLDFEAISESTHDKHFLIYRRPWYCTQTCPCFLARNAVKPIFYAIFHADYPSETLFCTFLSFKSKQEKHINQFLPPKWSHAIHGHKSSFYVPVRAVRPRLSTSSDS